MSKSNSVWLLAILLLIASGACAKKSGASAEAEGLIKQKKYDEGIALMEKAYAADSSNAALKARLVAANVEYGNELTYKSELPPNEKYRKALKFYRRALELDPQQQEAAQGKNLIESIYASMGRPVPQ